MSTEKDAEKIERIRKYIMKSGFPTEIEVGNVLRKSGWMVINQAPYMDEITKVFRSIDVVGFKSGPKPSIPGFVTIIECKKSEQHDWVFHTQPKEGEFYPALLTILEFFKKLGHPAILRKLQGLANSYDLEKLLGLRSSSMEIANKLNGLHFLDKNIKIALMHVIPNSKDDFAEAIQQIASILKNISSGQSAVVIFPVIVFDGSIYEFYIEAEDTKVFPINHVQIISWQDRVAPCMIDIVRKKYFSKFLNKIEQDISIYNEFISSA